jgi:hypothetical protein
MRICGPGDHAWGLAAIGALNAAVFSSHFEAPQGALLKRAAADPSLFEKEGRAVVVTSLEDLFSAD